MLPEQEIILQLGRIFSINTYSPEIYRTHLPQ